MSIQSNIFDEKEPGVIPQLTGLDTIALENNNSKQTNALSDNPYKVVRVNNINLHMGNGAKNELKKEKHKYNFKFYYKVGQKFKNCSAGFDDIKSFIDFITPINGKYYIYEYIFQNKKCIPYFDYEYELSIKPSDNELTDCIIRIKKLIKKAFAELFKVDLLDDNIIIMSSHGFKSNKKFKVSFHVIVNGYYFVDNAECNYVCEKLKEDDKFFDSSVYSKDRMMRCCLSSKNWDDGRTLVPVDKIITMDQFDEYLITNIGKEYALLKCPIKIKKIVNKQKCSSKMALNVKRTNGKELDEQDHSDIALLIEKIVKQSFNEDAFYIKSMNKFDDITFYEFNYNDRSKQCFSGHTHDRLGFYCYVDNLNNILVKCFSDSCKGYKKVIGNLNKNVVFENAIEINNSKLSENNSVIKLLNSFAKSLVFKSDMGTGKTYAVVGHITKHNPKRILWISTRQTYSNNVNKNLKALGFVNYLDRKSDWWKEDRIIVQLESLYRLENNADIEMFDLIVLDEIESVLAQFASTTIAERSENIFNLLHILCKCPTTKIIAMDADLNTRSLEFMKDIDPDYKLVVNHYRNKTITLHLTNNRDYFINEIRQAIDDKKKICIIGLSTKLLEQIVKFLKEWGVNYLLHTRNSDDSLKKELEVVNELWINFDIVLYSPTISVGVDFSEVYFDLVFSIVVPDAPSPRVYKQMLGRIRNMKTDFILTYYQNISPKMDAILYNYEEMIDYFKYADPEVKTNKIYKVEDNCLNIVSGFTLYDRMMMYNRIEELNKSYSYFMTELYVLFSESNYKIQFLGKITEKRCKYILDDDVYKDKIMDASDVDMDEFAEICDNINNNLATEANKFSFEKYKFKRFWNIETVDKENLKLYFRCEHTMNRLLMLYEKPTLDDDYKDYDASKKINVIKNIVKTLGFNLNDLTIKLSKDMYYNNVDLLKSADNSFKKDYNNIRILFGKEKHVLKDNLSGSALAKLLNGFLEDFGLYLNNRKTCRRINGQATYASVYELKIMEKYKKCF